MTHPRAAIEDSKFPHQAKWKSNNQKKVWAQSALRAAVRRGLITPEPCKVCGSEPSEAHHGDYDRPMDVSWLCRVHHKAEHARLKAGGGEE